MQRNLKEKIKINNVKNNQGYPGNKQWIIIGLVLSTLNASFGMSVVNVALPTFSNFFAIPIQTIQWVVISYLLGITVAVVFVGRLGDILGNRKVLFFGLILFTFSSLVCSISTSFGILTFARILQGIGASALITISIAVVPKIVNTGQVGLIMGLISTTSALGTMLGPALGGILISQFGWPSIFIPHIFIGSFACLIVYRFFPESEQTSSFQFSILNTKSIFFLSLALLCYSLFSTLGQLGLSTQKLLLLAGTVLGISFFANSERKSKNPLINQELLQNRNLFISLLINFFVATVMMSTLIVGPFYLSNALNFQEDSAGLLLSIGPLASVMSGLPAGKLVDRYGSKKLLRLALFIMSIATILLAVLPLALGLAGYLIAILLLTPGYQLFLAANNTHVMMQSKKSNTGIISSMLSLSRNIGLISGASVMGAIFAAVVAQDISTASPLVIMKGMKITYLIASLLVIISLILTISNFYNRTSKDTYVETS